MSAKTYHQASWRRTGLLFRGNGVRYRVLRRHFCLQTQKRLENATAESTEITTPKMIGNFVLGLAGGDPDFSGSAASGGVEVAVTVGELEVVDKDGLRRSYA